MEERIAGQTAEHNLELERRVRELRIEKLELERELKAEREKQEDIGHQLSASNESVTSDAAANNTSMSSSNSSSSSSCSDTVNGNNKLNGTESTKSKVSVDDVVVMKGDGDDQFREYPPESTVIQNLLQAQVEFYFSDYNLKRDKRLLSDVVAPPKKGFLALEEVMKLSRIRQLCSEIETLEEALRRSAILTLIREKITEKDGGGDKMKKEEERMKEKKREKTSGSNSSGSGGGGSDGDDEAEDEVKSDDHKPNTVDGEGYRIWVGRANFEKPREKEFPFRRTVFLFGIPHEHSQEFVNEMLKPFGSISKTQFDLSPDGIDRKIGHRFLNKPRVYTLYYSDNNKASSMTNLVKVNGLGGSTGPDGGGGGSSATDTASAAPSAGGVDDDDFMSRRDREVMIFKTSYEDSGGKPLSAIKCHKCGKIKTVSEGFYTTSGWQVIYCSQCAAQLAEDQLNLYYKERNIPQYQHYPRNKWLGSPPADHSKRRTALVVFASQRQASKCAYVRTRIAHQGAFATHFHHYSKVKKEVVLSESMSDHENTKHDDNGTAGDSLSANDSPKKSPAKPVQHGHGQQGQQQNRGGHRGGMRGMHRGYSTGNDRRGNFQPNQRGRGGHQRGGYAQRAWSGNRMGFQERGRGRGGGQMMMNQYGNYGQQSGAMYHHGSPQKQQNQRANFKSPGLFRQSSAPTTSGR